jgi:hypothetical protein
MTREHLLRCSPAVRLQYIDVADESHSPPTGSLQWVAIFAVMAAMLGIAGIVAGPLQSVLWAAALVIDDSVVFLRSLEGGCV